VAARWARGIPFTGGTSVAATFARLGVVRDAAGGSYLESFLVWTVVAFLGIRGYLELTGYPQLGGGELHIAHMLWGGLLMLVALAALLAGLGQWTKRFGAIAGGLGFGTFIDELGKFITRDNDYFYKPTVGLIYVILLVLFLTFRWLSRGRTLSGEERLINAAAMIPELLHDGATRAELQQALLQLDGSGARGPVPDAIRAAILAAATTPPPPATGSPLSRWIAGVAARGREVLDRVLASPLFDRILLGIFVLSAVGDVLVLLIVLTVVVVGLVVPGADMRVDLDWTDVGAGISFAVSATLTVLGALRLRRSRREALVLFRRALLVSIYFSEVFLFFQHQLAALGGLAQNVLLLLAVEVVLRREVRPVLPDPESARPAPETVSSRS
jgi:hypothetical protein